MKKTMGDIKSHNFWYAVNNTEVVLMPKSYLETFGTTNLRYHMVSELMDTVNRIRIREGGIQSRRPQLITPAFYSNEVLEGFGSEANEYAEWLKKNAGDMRVLQYGFQIQKTDSSEQVVSGNVRDIIEQVKAKIAARNDPTAAVIYGVDNPWDVCLLKFMVDVIRTSAPHNFSELGRRRLLDDVNGVPRAVRDEIEGDFLAASRDRAAVEPLGKKLRRYGLFEEYEDRFFALFRKTEPAAGFMTLPAAVGAENHGRSLRQGAGAGGQKLRLAVAPSDPPSGLIMKRDCPKLPDMFSIQS